MHIICLMGPTAAGKTQIALDLARQFPVDIISVDSAMVYRGMNIGTAKPNAAILQEIPHRLIDICDPSEIYSAAQFVQDAEREIKAAHARQRVPLLVGGTMMYFRALQQGLADLPAANAEIRAQLTAEAEFAGWPKLHQRLAKIDGMTAARVHPHDQQRIQRALEVYQLTGNTLTQWQSLQAERPLVNARMLNLVVWPEDRTLLHQHIAERFSQMLADGLVEEVKSLFDRGDLNLSLPALRSVGYRQVWDYLAGHSSYEEMRSKAVIATCQLAKRQLTWLRHWPNTQKYDAATVLQMFHY